MNPKRIVTAVLLAFVAVSVVFLVAKERRPGTPGNAEPTPQTSVENAGEASPAPVTGAAPSEGAPPVARGSVEDARESSAGPPASTSTIVYYFHGTRRCPTCRKLEEYTREAVMGGFAEDVKAGTIAWRPVNTDDPGNEHYVNDYALSTKSVVLSAMTGGTETRWKNLTRIWDLVGDKAAFVAYIQDEVEAFREGR